MLAKGGEGKPVGTQHLSRANVARAHHVETRQVIGAMIGERDACSIEHLQEEIQNTSLVSLPMNSLTLSRYRNSEMSKRKTLSLPNT